MKIYEMVIRHEPQTHRESEEGWLYEHYKFEEESDDLAIEKAKSLCGEIGDECSESSLKNLRYGCYHSVDELYRLEETGRVSIYDDGVYQSISWDKDGKERRIKRFTDGTLINFFRTRW